MWRGTASCDRTRLANVLRARTTPGEKESYPCLPPSAFHCRTLVSSDKTASRDFGLGGLDTSVIVLRRQRRFICVLREAIRYQLNNEYLIIA